MKAYFHELLREPIVRYASVSLATCLAIYIGAKTAESEFKQNQRNLLFKTCKPIVVKKQVEHGLDQKKFTDSFVNDTIGWIVPKKFFPK